MTGPRVLRPKMDRDVAKTIVAVVKAEQRHLLTKPVGMIRDRALTHCRSFLDAVAEEVERDTPARSKRQTVEHYQREAKRSKAGAR